MYPGIESGHIWEGIRRHVEDAKLSLESGCEGYRLHNPDEMDEMFPREGLDLTWLVPELNRSG
jgi:hypothetical protein